MLPHKTYRKNPEEREAAVAVRGPRILKGEDVHVYQVVPAATTHQGTPAAPLVTLSYDIEWLLCLS